MVDVLSVVREWILNDTASYIYSLLLASPYNKLMEKIEEGKLNKLLDEYNQRFEKQLDMVSKDGELDLEGLKKHTKTKLFRGLMDSLLIDGSLYRKEEQRRLIEDTYIFANAKTQEQKKNVDSYVSILISFLKECTLQKLSMEEIVQKNLLEDSLIEQIKWVENNLKIRIEKLEKPHDCMVDRAQAKEIIKDMREASEKQYYALKSPGGRFNGLNIIPYILPQGYIEQPEFHIMGKIDENTKEDVVTWCKTTQDNVAVTGNGGTGKTTALYELMGDIVEKKNWGENTIPFFIELNRCPEQIQEWYDDTLRKSNFITRYIARMVEGHESMDAVDRQTIQNIEIEFQREAKEGEPQYLLLLDGFNEVKTDKNLSIRSQLSNEITVLSGYRNVRIITTSRLTQAAYYASKFKHVPIVGLDKEIIWTHLKKCERTDTEIELIMRCKPLVECLKVPLYLCMFSAQNSLELLPETPGEIFYYFFHRNSAFYNIRSRVKDIRTNQLTDSQTAFVLDFILPYIGWNFEKEDCFSVNEIQFENMISEAVFCIQSYCRGIRAIPFSDFRCDARTLLRTADEFYVEGSINTDAIINCIHGYLGIVYGYETNQREFSERNRYAFAHHQFRDYFSAMWDVQLLQLTQCITSEKFLEKNVYKDKEVSLQKMLDNGYWAHNKTEFISQILMEHRNVPVLIHPENNWVFPPEKADEQRVLLTVIDFCRQLQREKVELTYLLQNVLSAIIAGRKELSGIDLSELNLERCNFFNVTCSRKGSTETLRAKFDGTILSENNFEPVDHRDYVVEMLYHQSCCYTLDQAGSIKCWDVKSGKRKYELFVDCIALTQDMKATGFMKISSDGKWLAVRVQRMEGQLLKAGVILYDIYSDMKSVTEIFPENIKSELDYFTFTEDNNAILFVFNKKTISCYSLKDFTLIHEKYYEELLSETRVFANSEGSSIYVFTAEYNQYSWSDEYEEEDDFAELSIPCKIYSISADRTSIKGLYSFAGAPKTTPTIQYIPGCQSFLLYNHRHQGLQLFDCRERREYSRYGKLTVDNDMPPDFIHCNPENANECYIMYSDICYLVDVTRKQGDGILLSYPISEAKEILFGPEQEGELTFKTSVVPYKNLFIVGNDDTCYEWNTDEDILLMKYGTIYYSCVALFRDQKRKQFILVHQNNGITVFGGNPPKVQNGYSFYEQEYHIEKCSFHEESALLAVSFAKTDHEKVLLMSMENGNQQVCYSTHKENETIMSLCFDEKGASLLITTQYQCTLYDILEETLTIIVKAKENERIVGGNFNKGSIEVAITPHKEIEGRPNEARCDIYKRCSQSEQGSYYSDEGYIIPELTDKHIPYFIFEHGDTGAYGALDDDDIQHYWITRGFFLKDIEQYIQLPKGIEPLRMYYFRHVRALERRYTLEDMGFSYSFLQNNEILFMQKSADLFYHDNYKECTYKEVQQGFLRKLGNKTGYSYWSYAIPFGKSIIGCYESYRLMTLDAEDRTEEIDYTPGLAIYGCSFKDVLCDDELKEELKRNGGDVR